jgi:hypothetical protein
MSLLKVDRLDAPVFGELREMTGRVWLHKMTA